MTQDIVSGLAEELAYRYIRIKENAIYTALMKAEGCIPCPSVIAQSGMIVRCRVGNDDYEQFNWKDRPMFQIRLLFNDHKATIEVNHL